MNYLNISWVKHNYYFRFKMFIIMGFFFSGIVFQKETLRSCLWGPGNTCFVIFSYSNLSSVYAVELRNPAEYFLALWGQLQTPIKANLALPTCNVEKYTSTQRCMRFLLMCLSFYSCSNCFYASSPTGKAKGTLAKSPCDYPQGPCCSSPTFKPLGLILYV